MVGINNNVSSQKLLNELRLPNFKQKMELLNIKDIQKKKEIIKEK
jgi:hypothetical protein